MGIISYSQLDKIVFLLYYLLSYPTYYAICINMHFKLELDNNLMVFYMVRTWICKLCGKEFNPLRPEGDFDFNCPECGSEVTVPKMDIEKK